MLTAETIVLQDENEYMSDEQLAFFKQRLLLLKEKTQESIDVAHATLHERTGSADQLDSAFDEEIREITLMRLSRDTQLLHEIDDAIERIHSHDYGYCMETGDPLGIPRLLANPTAQLCTSVLSEREERVRIDGFYGQEEGDEGEDERVA